MRARFRALVAAVAAGVVAVTTAACSGGGTSQQTESSTTSVPSTGTMVVVPDLTSGLGTSQSATSTTASSSASSTIASSSTTGASSSTPTVPAVPTDPLTGLAPSPNPVIAVKIDNTSAAMPQFGIADADIIYGEQVEGGLTRLIAIFHTTLPDEVGAVRSIRSTDMQLLPSFGRPLLVASGGATAQLDTLAQSVLVGVMDGAAGFWRSSAKRAPYNLHANLVTIAENHPGQGIAQPMGFAFGAEDARLAAARAVATIDVTMISGRFVFDYQDGSYLAHRSSTPYVDQTGKKVTVQNVIVQHVRDEPDGTIDPAGNPSFLTHTVGSGSFTLYRDGKAIDGTWSRAAVSDPTEYLDANGEPVTLRPGKTWVLLAPQTSTVNKG